MGVQMYALPKLFAGEWGKSDTFILEREKGPLRLLFQGYVRIVRWHGVASIGHRGEGARTTAQWDFADFRRSDSPRRRPKGVEKKARSVVVF